MQLQRAGATVWAHALQAVVVVMAVVPAVGVVVAQGEVVVAPAMRKARRTHMREDRRGRRHRQLHMAASANHQIHPAALPTVMLSMVIAAMTAMMMAVMADL